jgi:hypothetical protein
MNRKGWAEHFSCFMKVGTAEVKVGSGLDQADSIIQANLLLGEQGQGAILAGMTEAEKP